MALNGIPISEDQCIGDSLDTINNSFSELDSRTLGLSSTVANLTTTVLSLCAIGVASYSKLKFTADGSSFYDVSSLAGTLSNAFIYRVDIDGVVQEPGTNASNGDYYFNFGNLIFSTAPAIGTKIVVVGPQL